MTFCQCKSNTNNKVLDDRDNNSMNQDNLKINHNSTIGMDELGRMGIDKDILLKYIKLQKLAGMVGTFVTTNLNQGMSRQKKIFY